MREPQSTRCRERFRPIPQVPRRGVSGGSVTEGGLPGSGVPRGGIPRAVIVLAVSLLSVGCTSPPAKTSLAPDRESLWSSAESARLEGRHAEAAELYATFYRYHYRDTRAGEALLDAGVEFAKAGLPARAHEHLIAATERTEPRIASSAWLHLGYLERGAGRHAVSAMHFGDAARTSRDDETRAEALLEAGISLQKAGAFEEANRPLRACVDLAGVAPRHAAEARTALRQEPYFTVQVAAFADRTRAAQQVEALATAGFPAVVTEGRTDSGVVHRVTSGRFLRRPEVEAHALRLRQHLGRDVLIRP